MIDIFLFDKNKEVIEAVPSSAVLVNEQNSELNGLITHAAIGVYTDAIEETHFFGMKDVDDDGVFWRYKLDRSKKDSGQFILDGTYELFDDLKSRTVIKDRRPQDMPAGEALGYVLEGTGWEVGNVSSQRTGTSNWYYISPLEAFWDYLSKWNVEFKPRMIYSKGKVIRKVIDIADQLSGDYGKRYEYGDRLLTVVAEEDSTNLFTAFVGRGKGEETDTGAYGRRLTIEDVEWSIAKGNPVDKPRGQNYIEIPEATALYGFEDGSPRFTVVIFEEIEDPEELAHATYNHALEESRPKAQFSATVQEEGPAELGEVKTIIRDDLGVRYKTRVFKLKRNFLNKRIKQIEFGDQINQSRAKRNQAVTDQLNRKLDENNVFWLEALRDAITDSYFNNDGYNYDLHAGNKYSLPGGFYSFDRPIDENPTKVVYMGAGTILISNKKDSSGKWVWRTALNAEGIMADWIVGYNSEFVKSSWNAINSRLDVDGSQLKFKHTDGSETIMNAAGLIHREGGTNYETNYLFDIITVTGLNNFPSSQRWIQLPAIYKGKRFKAVAVLSDAYGHTESPNYNRLNMQRIVSYVDHPNIDYTNARVPVVGYVYTRDSTSGAREFWPIQVQVLVQF